VRGHQAVGGLLPGVHVHETAAADRREILCADHKDQSAVRGQPVVRRHVLRPEQHRHRRTARRPQPAGRPSRVLGHEQERRGRHRTRRRAGILHQQQRYILTIL